jgi:thymidine kinase
VLGIDEGQFFPDIVSFCEDMANAGKLVIVAALDGTFQRKVNQTPQPRWVQSQCPGRED